MGWHHPEPENTRGYTGVEGINKMIVCHLGPRSRFRISTGKAVGFF